MNYFSRMVCPISKVRIDGRVSRITVLFNSILIGLFLFTRSPIYIGIVAFDYGLRAFGLSKFSLLRLGASGCACLLRLTPALIDQAPKLFASRVGFLFAAVSGLLYLFGFKDAAWITAAVLCIFTLLDSLFNFCVGCLTYHHLVFPFYDKRQTR